MKKTKTLLWKNEDIPESQVRSIANSVFDELKKNESFCLWLEGEMGAGKTRITRDLLQLYGLSQKTTVPSPTYSLINEYEIHTDLFFHIDLYRVGSNIDIEDLGISSDRKTKGIIVEWPVALIEQDILNPSHSLTITTTETKPHSRTYHFYAYH